MAVFSHCSEQDDIEIFKAMFLMNLHKDGNKSEGILLLQLLQKKCGMMLREQSL